MNLYPFDLVLAVGVAAASIFLGFLPVRQMGAPFFTRQVPLLGAGWLLVAAWVPQEIFHYYLGLALLCGIAWWQVRAGHSFRGKLWLCMASGMGIGFGPVLILAVMPGAWPMAGFPWSQVVFLLALATGGAIPGVASALFALTRPTASEAGVRTSQIVNVLLGLALGRAGLLVIELLVTTRTDPSADLERNQRLFLLLLVLMLAVVPALTWMARRQCRSPSPSTAGPSLLLTCAGAFAAECLALVLHL